MRRGERQKPTLGLTFLVWAEEADLNFKIIFEAVVALDSWVNVVNTATREGRFCANIPGCKI